MNCASTIVFPAMLDVIGGAMYSQIARSATSADRFAAVDDPCPVRSPM